MVFAKFTIVLLWLLLLYMTTRNKYQSRVRVKYRRTRITKNKKKLVLRIAFIQLNGKPAAATAKADTCNSLFFQSVRFGFDSICKLNTFDADAA